MNFIFNLINLAAVEKTKRKNIIELQYCTNMSRREIQKMKFEKNLFLFFFQFSKNWVGKTKDKKTLALSVLLHWIQKRSTKSFHYSVSESKIYFDKKH